MTIIGKAGAFPSEWSRRRLLKSISLGGPAKDGIYSLPGIEIRWPRVQLMKSPNDKAIVAQFL